MAEVVHRAGEGEGLFGGRIVIKAAFDQLTVTESRFASARPGAEPHFHRQHADSFSVLEGELAFLVEGGEESLLGPGACVCVPAGVVHAFRSTSRARFLNLHTPDAGFADNLRAIDRGEPGGFDSVDAPVGEGPGGSSAILLNAAEGERRKIRNGVATTKIECAELSLAEFALEPGSEEREPPIADDRVSAYYVLEGEVQFLFDAGTHLLGAGSFVAVLPEIVHRFSSGPAPVRLLMIQAPSSGSYDWLGEGS